MLIIFTTFSRKYEAFKIPDNNCVVIKSEKEKLFSKCALIPRFSKSSIKNEERGDLNEPS